MRRKPKLVTVRALDSIAPKIAELMVTRLGMPAICQAAKIDRIDSIYNLIRPLLPAGLTDREVLNVAEYLYDKKAAPLMAPLPPSGYVPSNVLIPADDTGQEIMVSHYKEPYKPPVKNSRWSLTEDN